METLSVPTETVRRLVVAKQHLAGTLPRRASANDILSVIRDLAYVQWDPVSIVAPSHIISLWSRLGNFRLSDLERLMWAEKELFQHWTPIASIVLTEDYPLYLSLMKRYPGSLSGSWKPHEVRARRFLAGHKELRKRMLTELRRGPLQLSQFGDYARTKRSTDGWTTGSDVSLMLFHLHMSGEVMVVGHQGNQNVWGLTRDVLPDWAGKEPLAEEEFESQAAQRAIRALGTATPSEINYYFVRGRYRTLKKTLARLREESAISRVTLEGLGRDERYIHAKDLPLLDSLSSGAWQPRTSLIAPFDNLICGRARANKLFGFDYAHEQFLPREKRKFGTYVLPILWGERLVGRADLQMDKQNERLLVNSVHSERGAPEDTDEAAEIGESAQRFAEFLGAKEVVYTPRVPSFWKSSLR